MTAERTLDVQPEESETMELMTHAREAAPFLERKVRLSKQVVFREFSLETVVLNLETGSYYGLNAVALRMLEALRDEETIGAAVRRLAHEYGHPAAEIERDLAKLCERLLLRGLIELGEGEEG